MRVFLALFIILSLLGCSSKLRIENGLLTHMDLYQVPLLDDSSWVRIIPAARSDALYLRCPGEQRIVVLYTMLCGKYDYDQMSEDDYAKRIYLNTFFSTVQNIICPRRRSPLTDSNFKKMVEPPSVNKDKKQFTIVYETAFDHLLCSSNTATTPLPIKIMDVFIQEPKFHSWGSAHTRFVVLRYASPIDQYESGLFKFQDLVSKFKWLE